MAGRDAHSSWPLGPFLNEARLARQLSQKAAAARAGISRTAWQQLESGERADHNQVRPKSSTVIAAAMAVDADPTTALELAGLDPSAFEPARAGRPTATFAEARALLAQLTEPQRRAVIDLLRAFVHETPAEPFRTTTTLGDPEPPHGAPSTYPERMRMDSEPEPEPEPEPGPVADLTRPKAVVEPTEPINPEPAEPPD
ncbi:helix-turn-helix domain-containing protein [Actinokineospora sp.]|uniref:helix-turn-helix domain-containing protein n=1 Tax=Actinokineospora sp. TaxID=1872133 RepID=UPI003D6B37B5